MIAYFTLFVGEHCTHLITNRTLEHKHHNVLMISSLLIVNALYPYITLGFPPLSPIGRIQILTYLIWGILDAAIFDCLIRSCDLFDWFIRTCFGSTVIPAIITSLELFWVLTLCYFSDNVSSKENIIIL